jgi:serine/threonine protein phosphatase PrpC
MKSNIYFTSVKGRRDDNEDRHNIILNIDGSNENILPINFLSVYDGHGGKFVSTYLSKNLPLYYCNPSLQLPFSTDYHIKLFENIQNKILDNPEGYSSGSTCSLCIMYRSGNEIHMNIVNLGDSRLTIVYKEGQSKQVTIDHKPDDPIETKRLTKMGGEIYTDTEGVVRIGDLSLSRSFGDGDNAPYISQKPDIFYKKLTPETKYIVLACDGLWDVIQNEELYDLLESFKKQESKNLAADLASAALQRGSTDNISIIIVEII